MVRTTFVTNEAMSLINHFFSFAGKKWTLNESFCLFESEVTNYYLILESAGNTARWCFSL